MCTYFCVMKITQSLTVLIARGQSQVTRHVYIIYIYITSNIYVYDVNMTRHLRLHDHA